MIQKFYLNPRTGVRVYLEEIIWLLNNLEAINIAILIGGNETHDERVIV